MSIMTFTQSSLYSIIQKNLNKQQYVPPINKKSKIVKNQICKV